MQYPDIDPVAISLGPLQIHWYGVMYLIGFIAGWALARARADRWPGASQKGDGGVFQSKNSSVPFLTKEEVADLIFYGALGVVLGGRIGYMLFYRYLPDPGSLLDDPLGLIRVWEGGMSFHGGLLGVVLAAWLFARNKGKSFMRLLDFAAPLVPIGLGAGRLGNFIGAELWGRPTDVPWAMVFPGAGPLPRHPSQLYEFLLEGVVLFIVLWIYSARPRPLMAVAAMFSLLYGIFRFFVEFYREPDEHIGYLFGGWFTQGMLLSLPMIAAGALVLYLAYRHDTFGKMARS